MADGEANDSNRPNRRTSMDLNLYLGLPRSPRRPRPDLGSDLALSSIPMNSSSSSSVASIEDSNNPANRSSSVHIETAESQPHPPYSPTTPAMDPNLQIDRVLPSPEYTPYFPSYESFNTAYPLVDPNPLPPVHELDEGTNSSLMIVDDPVAFSAENHVPYSPPYVASPSLPPAPPPQQAYMPHSSSQESPNEDIPFSFYPPLPSPSRYMTASHAELLRPEIRFRRLIETSHRLRSRRFRSSFSHGSVANYPNVASASTIGVTAAEPQTGQEMVACDERTAVVNVRKDKVKLETGTMEEAASDEESKENAQNNGANFECNICFEMASEPVVTSCGHLFCWPCLYQWVHVHSDHRECPVCKGEVTDTNITPIYGRGSSDSNGEKVKSIAPIGEDGVKIPPRPRGNRVESFRQQFRPTSRRFSEGIASMRRLWDPQIRPGSFGPNRFDPNVDAAMHEILDGAQRRVLTRLRARRLQREEHNVGNNSSSTEVMPHVMVDTPVNPRPPLMNHGSSSANPNPNSASLFRDGIDLWHRFSLYGLANTERLAAITADLGRVVGRFASISGTNNNGASTSASPLDPSSSERPQNGTQVAAALAADQVSASSTMAVIQGDPGAATGNSEGPASALERPNSSAGSSRAQRRRVRTGGNGTAGTSTSSGGGNTGGSLDVDGGPAHHLRKRRRLN
jgi:E3 ubiquitin-protein ligase RNF5